VTVISYQANNKAGEQISLSTELRTWLKSRLPEYMLPASVTVLDKLPLTPNGKIDRKALSQLSVNHYLSEGEFVAPRTREEKLLADIWTEVLGIPRVGIHNNFFDLGGHSLLLLRVQAKLTEFLDQKISMVELFEHPTIHALGQHLTQKQSSKPIQKVSNQGDKPRRRGQALRKKRQIRKTTVQKTNSLGGKNLSMTKLQSINESDVAIIGMSCRLPGAENVEDFWQNIRDGVESISFFSDEELLSSGIKQAILNQANYVNANGILSGIELFDAAFFDFSPKEAEITEPQHRLFLECAWEAIENAGGYLPSKN
jgi:hypothetical protein